MQAPTGAIGYRTTAEAKRAADIELRDRQCKAGRHQHGCPHRQQKGS